MEIDRSRSPYGHAVHVVPPVLGLPGGAPVLGQLGASAAPDHVVPAAVTIAGAQDASSLQVGEGWTFSDGAISLAEAKGWTPIALRPQMASPTIPNLTGVPMMVPSPEPSLTAEEIAQQKRAKEQEERRSIEAHEGYFSPPRVGYEIAGGDSRYIAVDVKPLGVGVFSAVWSVADKENKLIALKVVRKQDHFRKYAEREVKILQRARELAGEDLDGADQVCMLRDHFVHRLEPSGDEHLCMAFQKLQNTLRDAGKQPLDKVLAYGKQLMHALRFLHETVGLVHCDVKPDNLLLRHDNLAVKLCDFGTARTPTELQTVDEVQPLFYRAPEVFMGSTRGRKIDVWSAGCTLHELAVGRILFRACHTHREVVEAIMQLRGPMPEGVKENGRLTKTYFSSRGFHREVGDPVSPDSFKKKSMAAELAAYIDYGKAEGKSAQEQARNQLSKLIGRATVISAANKRSKVPTQSERKLQQLGELIDLCMEIDPSKRVTASAACGHDAFKDVPLPPPLDLQEAPPLPEAAPPPLPDGEAPPPR